MWRARLGRFPELRVYPHIRKSAASGNHIGPRWEYYTLPLYSPEQRSVRQKEILIKLLSSITVLMVTDHCFLYEANDFITIPLLNPGNPALNSGKVRKPVENDQFWRQKKWIWGPKKRHSHDPYWHGLFAEKTGQNWSIFASMASCLFYTRLSKGVATLYPVSPPR